MNLYMRKCFTIILLLCVTLASYAQQESLVPFADNEQEADFQYCYAIDEADEEVMSRATQYDNEISNISDASDEPSKLWAILVADTYDRSIGDDDKLDNQMLNRELKAIANCLGIEISITNILANDAYNKRNLANAISRINPGPNDIVFFCFNGHGFRWNNQKDMYPNICMGSGNNNYVSTTDIYNAIKEKGARLSIVFTDCCNSNSGSYRPRYTENTLYSRANVRASKKRIRSLFLESKGVLLATAAKPGEYSWSFSSSGSAFTQSFIAQLRREVSNDRTDDTSWQRLIDNTIEAARKKTLVCKNSQHGMRYLKMSK